MQVFLAYESYYSGKYEDTITEFFGVFSTEELAIEAGKKGRFGYGYVTEFTVDEE